MSILTLILLVALLIPALVLVGVTGSFLAHLARRALSRKPPGSVDAIEAKPTVKLLFELLKTTEPTSRLFAIEQLSRLGAMAPSVIQALEPLAESDPNLSVRLAAQKVLQAVLIQGSRPSQDRKPLEKSEAVRRSFTLPHA